MHTATERPANYTTLGSKKSVKTAIVYYSQHHGNTKKLIDAIAEKHEVTLIDVTKNGDVDLSQFELAGFASGIYYSKFNDKVVEYAKKNLAKNDQKVFMLYTYGAKRDSYLKDNFSTCQFDG